MRAREYTKRVELYTTTAVPDTYGGSTVTDSLFTTAWAKIRTPSKNDVERGVGVLDPANQIIINLRNRIDRDYTIINYVKYNSIKYVINSIFNLDLLDIDIEILATKQVIVVATPDGDGPNLDFSQSDNSQYVNII